MTLFIIFVFINLAYATAIFYTDGLEALGFFIDGALAGWFLDYILQKLKEKKANDVE